ncbi:hypothetical protein [Desulfobotulus mexicanus]|uniref:Rpn family recombination-promoting nuclease/putative transposase n=1 Tax=Desulfobotulus mexicanus TaxID=2586642 RepID=A0A5S5MFK0_9BACT|nr:hypothetical protein [Desulfobotulus mexicanus]TYT74468.1 hypothetical protein FIM25_09960 [Desulfobotulus mexicanus]
MAARKKKKNDYDSPWKEILEKRFPEFLALLFPQIYEEIDWSRKPEFIDKELQKIAWDSNIKRRYADKLVKVWTKKNHEILVIIHIEVQGDPEVDFSERMYVYNYRIFDHHRTMVVSLGVLTDNQKSFRPDSYSRELWGCSLDFHFPIVKLMEWEDRWDELENSENVFSLAVMAQIKAKSSSSKDELKSWKIHLVRLMYKRNYDKTTILEFFRVIDWMMRLPEVLDKEFLQEIYQIEEDRKMPYITSAERFGMERGMKLGMEMAMEKSVEKLRKEKFQTIIRLTKLDIKPEIIASGVGLSPEKVKAVLAAGDKGLELLTDKELLEN